MSDEITLNLWYVVDDVGIIYSLRVRTYIGKGSDEEKLEQLRKLATIDYLIAYPYPIPEKYHLNGHPVCHQSLLVAINKVDLFSEAIDDLQSKLPSQTSLDIPKKPLVCITPLFGDDLGNIRPQFDGTEYFSS